MNTITATSLALGFSMLCLSCTRAPNEDVKLRKGEPARVKRAGDLKFKHDSFTFVRIQYSSQTKRPNWMTDYPDADANLTARFQKDTGLPCAGEGKVMTLTASELSSYPFIYIAEGGELHFSDAEVTSLRSYLVGGGFLMVDDFWGEEEWISFAGEMKRVFPEYEPVELPIGHALFHSFYDIHEKPQVPNVALGNQSQFTGITWEREDAKEAHYRGLFDGTGRLMAVFCHNTDLGDGWERSDPDSYFSREFSLKRAFPMGINIIVYALTQ